MALLQVRCISAAIDDPHAAYAIAFVGQFICACAQPFFMGASTKLAANWFDHDQKAAANSLVWLPCSSGS
jgi:predicted MFS family arabinose efflux permease